MADIESGKKERVTGYLILFILLVIGVSILIRQSHYDPSLFVATAPKGSIIADQSWTKGQTPNLLGYVPEGFLPLSAPEIFSPDNLSDKIDGKAELYLSSGFRNLSCQRFSKPGKTESWVELFVYDMGDARNAFSVFSSQRRSNAEELDFTRFAYRTGNSLFLVHGTKYVEIISASSSGEDILEIGKHIALANTSQNAEIPEIALFPSNYLIGNTITLHAGSVFGFERLDNTFTAHYIVSGQELTAFISLRKTAAEAAELITSYCQFLIDNGGSIVDHPSEISTAKIVHLFDTYEVVFTNGPMLAGVHEAENEDAAMELASLLYRGLHRELR